MAKMIRTAFPRRHLPGSGQAADSPATVRDALSGLPGATGADELMHAHADRIRNLEMAGGTFGPDAAGLDRSAKRRRERNPGRGERAVVRARTQDQVAGEREAAAAMRNAGDHEEAGRLEELAAAAQASRRRWWRRGNRTAGI